VRTLLPLLFRLVLLLPIALGSAAQPVLEALSHAHLLTTHGLTDASADVPHAADETHADGGEPLHFLTHHAHACGHAYATCASEPLRVEARSDDARAAEPSAVFVSACSDTLLRPPRTA